MQGRWPLRSGRSSSRHTTIMQIDAALAAGVAAYVLKTAHPNDVAFSVRQAFDHSVYVVGGPRPPGTASGMSATAGSEIPSGLTRRELEILSLVAEGHSNSQLARMLWVTEQTVKFHLSNIYRKLGVSNRTEASRWAQVNGLLSQQTLRRAPNPPRPRSPATMWLPGRARWGASGSLNPQSAPAGLNPLPEGVASERRASGAVLTVRSRAL